MRILLSLSLASFVTLVACGGDVSLGKDGNAVKAGKSCTEGTKTYADGETFKCADGCNTCSCRNGEISGTLMGCISDGGGAPVCTYDGKSYAAGATFPSSDGCNSCSCQADGLVACTERACGATCTYDGKSYTAGQSFPSTDGCNMCSCTSDGSVVCTERACALDGGKAP